MGHPSSVIATKLGEPRTQSYEENFGVNLLYAKILALLLVKKSDVTTLLPSDWFKFLE